jgi:hypothetical protein
MTNLRIKQVQGPQEGYVHEKNDPEIAPNPEHGGLRVKTVAKKGTALVRTHPQHPDRKAMAALGRRSR